MTAKNLLVSKAKLFSYREPLEDIEGCHYDKIVGAWIINATNEFLVKSQDPEKPRPGTKKEDIETGEDRKGE